MDDIYDDPPYENRSASPFKRKQSIDEKHFEQLSLARETSASKKSRYEQSIHLSLHSISSRSQDTAVVRDIMELQTSPHPWTSEEFYPYNEYQSPLRLMNQDAVDAFIARVNNAHSSLSPEALDEEWEVQKGMFPYIQTQTEAMRLYNPITFMSPIAFPETMIRKALTFAVFNGNIEDIYTCFLLYYQYLQFYHRAQSTKMFEAVAIDDSGAISMPAVMDLAVTEKPTHFFMYLLYDILAICCDSFDVIAIAKAHSALLILYKILTRPRMWPSRPHICRHLMKVAVLFAQLSKTTVAHDCMKINDPPTFFKGYKHEKHSDHGTDRIGHLLPLHTFEEVWNSTHSHELRMVLTQLKQYMSKHDPTERIDPGRHYKYKNDQSECKILLCLLGETAALQRLMELHSPFPVGRSPEYATGTIPFLRYAFLLLAPDVFPPLEAMAFPPSLFDKMEDPPLEAAETLEVPSYKALKLVFLCIRALLEQKFKSFKSMEFFRTRAFAHMDTLFMMAWKAMYMYHKACIQLQLRQGKPNAGRAPTFIYRSYAVVPESYYNHYHMLNLYVTHAYLFVMGIEWYMYESIHQFKNEDEHPSASTFDALYNVKMAHMKLYATTCDTLSTSQVEVYSIGILRERKRLQEKVQTAALLFLKHYMYSIYLRPDKILYLDGEARIPLCLRNVVNIVRIRNESVKFSHIENPDENWFPLQAHGDLISEDWKKEFTLLFTFRRNQFNSSDNARFRHTGFNGVPSDLSCELCNGPDHREFVCPFSTFSTKLTTARRSVLFHHVSRSDPQWISLFSIPLSSSSNFYTFPVNPRSQDLFASVQAHSERTTSYTEITTKFLGLLRKSTAIEHKSPVSNEHKASTEEEEDEEELYEVREWPANKSLPDWPVPKRLSITERHYKFEEELDFNTWMGDSECMYVDNDEASKLNERIGPVCLLGVEEVSDAVIRMVHSPLELFDVKAFQQHRMLYDLSRRTNLFFVTYASYIKLNVEFIVSPNHSKRACSFYTKYRLMPPGQYRPYFITIPHPPAISGTTKRWDMLTEEDHANHPSLQPYLLKCQREIARSLPHVQLNPQQLYVDLGGEHPLLSIYVGGVARPL
jgi:hypothetical protein